MVRDNEAGVAPRIDKNNTAIATESFAVRLQLNGLVIKQACRFRWCTCHSIRYLCCGFGLNVRNQYTSTGISVHNNACHYLLQPLLEQTESEAVLTSRQGWENQPCMSTLRI